MFTFEQTKLGYANLWDKAKLSHSAQAKQQAVRILAAADRFKTVEKLTQVPWFMVGVLLYRESNLDLNTYLGNGQSLSRVTTVVPQGRGPFQSFEQGAVDAIKLEGMMNLAPWTLELMLYWIERFNGQGYFSHGNSPYVWAWTDQYVSGKFVSDHNFDPNFVDPQGGCAVILKALFEIDPTLMPPRIAQEKKMADPTPTTIPTTTAAHGLDLTQIAHGLETIIGFLPMAAKLFPPLAPLVPFIPLIQGGLKMAEELGVGPHDPQAIANIIVKHMQSIAQDVQAIKGTMPGASQNTSGG